MIIEIIFKKLSTIINKLQELKLVADILSPRYAWQQFTTFTAQFILSMPEKIQLNKAV